MKFMSTVLFLLLWGTAGRAETIYLLQREGCGDQIRYARSIDGRAASDYFAYRITLSPGSRLFLETDGGGISYRSSLPPRTVDGCAFATDERLADRINVGSVQLVVVRETEAGYALEPVVAAGLLNEGDDRLSYRSAWDGFTIDRQSIVAGEELPAAVAGQSVTLEGKTGEACTGAYLLRQERPGSSYPVVTYELHPELGVLTRYLVGGEAHAPGGMITARSINGISLSAYFRQLCRKSSGQLTSKSPAVPAPPIGIVHTVRPGETLYALSRRYGIGVQEIRRINGLSGNTIRIGQELRIQSGEESTQPVPPRNIPLPPAEVSPEPTAAAVTAPSRPIATSSQFHLVQGGETIAGLARRFGYTEERFRSFNNLGRFEQIAPGRQLRTSHCTCPPVTKPAPASAPYSELPRVPQPSEYVDPVSPVAPPPTGEGYSLPNASSPPPIRIVVPPAPAPTPEESIGARPELDPPTTPRPQAYTGPQPDPRQERNVHLVKEGETLYSIARSYRITVTRLMELNELGPTEVIAPFQKLYVN